LKDSKSTEKDDKISIWSGKGCDLNYTSNFVNNLDHYVSRGLKKNPTNLLLSRDPNEVFGERYYLNMDQRCTICDFLKDIGFIFEKRTPGHYENLLDSHPSDFIDVLEDEIQENERSEDFYIRKRTHKCVLTYGPLNMYYSGKHESIKFILCLIPIAFLCIVFTRILLAYVLESLIHWSIRTQEKIKTGYYANLEKNSTNKREKCSHCATRCKLQSKKCCHPLKNSMLYCCNLIHCRKGFNGGGCCKPYDYFDHDQKYALDYETL